MLQLVEESSKDAGIR
nr:synaptosomal-associated protein, Superprotein, SNAP-25=peptide 9 [rabbits, visual tissue, Peptide Partial, 15 aa] [Oryctolagus cuniculus]